MSLEKLDLTVGQWYYLSVYNALSSPGTFSLCANDQIPELTNKNNWCSALAAYSTVNASTEGPSSTCGGSGQAKSWFKFQAATPYIKLDAKTGGSEGTITYPEMTLWNPDLTAVTCRD